MAKVKWSHLPVAMPGGSLLPHMSARLRTETIDAVFHNVGGAERMTAWAEESNDNLTKFYEMWSRGAVRSTNVEHSAGEGFEAMLEKLERADNAKLIDGSATLVDTEE